MKIEIFYIVIKPLHLQGLIASFYLKESFVQNYPHLEIVCIANFAKFVRESYPQEKRPLHFQSIQ